MGVHPRFEPSAGAMELGAVPWPDDLYRDAAGRVQLARLPGALDAEYSQALMTAARDLDGFGATTPIYFFFDGDIDESTLPASVEASLEPNASVFLIDADTASPEAFERIPVQVSWQSSAQRIALLPSLAHALVPGRRYAAVVTTKLEDAQGHAIEASPRFAAVRDPGATFDDAVLLQARARYAPVIETLVNRGVDRDSIAGLAVFRVQNVTDDLRAAREIVRSAEAPSPTITSVLIGRRLDTAFGRVAGDVVGIVAGQGAAHDQIAAVAQGTIPSPNFLSATAKVHGAFERDETGELRIKRVEDVPFSLFWPKAPQRVSEGVGVPVVIYQHGIGRERSDAVVLANALAARGIAVIAIDAPFHGSRASGGDESNLFTGAAMSDGFGDTAGDFPGVSEKAGALSPLHPFYLRDALRQGAVDLMSVARCLEVGDFRALAEFHASLTGVAFDSAHMGFMGIDIGADMGVMFAGIEPKVGAIVLGTSGGGLTQGIYESPSNQAWFDALARKLGRDSSSLDATTDPLVSWPELALYQMLVERADPMLHASILRSSLTNVLMVSAHEDELVPERTTEALAFALGATLLGGPARFVSELPTAMLGPGTGIRGNYTIKDTSITRALYRLEPATHDALLHATGSFELVHPLERPFERLEEPSAVDNPTAATLLQVTRYFDEWYRCASDTTDSLSVCGAPAYVQ